MVQSAKNNSFPKQYWQELEDAIQVFSGVFHTSFRTTTCKLDALQIELLEDSKPVRVKIQNYSPLQRQFMKNLMN